MESENKTVQLPHTSLGMLTLSTKQGAFRNGWMAFYDDGAGYPLGGIDGVAETALDAVLRLAIEMAERTEI